MSHKEDFDLTQEEADRLKSALKDEKFRKLLSEYVEEISDPANKRQYEEEIIQLESERGVNVKFVNPTPGFVLKSVQLSDGKRHLSISVRVRQWRKHHQNLPWARCTERIGPSHSVYPQAERTWTNLAKDACVRCGIIPRHLRSLHLCVVIRFTACSWSSTQSLGSPIKGSTLKRQHQKPLNEPNYTITHHDEFSMLDYTYSKESTLIRRPRELVVSVELPGVLSADCIKLDVFEKQLSLECSDPIYHLELPLPYPVHEETDATSKSWSCPPYDYLQNDECVSFVLHVPGAKGGSVVTYADDHMIHVTFTSASHSHGFSFFASFPTTCKIESSSYKVDVSAENVLVVVKKSEECKGIWDKMKGKIDVPLGRCGLLNISEKLRGLQTNQRAEIVSACRALESAIEQGHKKVEVRTDSSYTIMAITEWMSTWKTNGWLTYNGEDVKNKEDFIRLEKLCQQIDVQWTHVRGHCGLEGNEAADALAKEGSRKL
eukprot:Em0179g12a